MCTAVCPNEYIPEAEACANASLYASAPDMLEALEAARPWIGGLSNENPYVKAVHDQLMRAIAKATGETE